MKQLKKMRAKARRFPDHREFIVKINRMSKLQSSHYCGGYAALEGGAVGYAPVAPGCPGG